MKADKLHEDSHDDEENFGGLMGHLDHFIDPRKYEVVVVWEPGQSCSNCACGKLHPVRDAFWCSVTTQSKKKGSPVAMNPKAFTHRCRAYIPSDSEKVEWVRVKKGLPVSKHNVANAIQGSSAQ
ncbi:MAG: hypothetical protein ABIK25_07365 [Pseudomonadota bacterium]